MKKLTRLAVAAASVLCFIALIINPVSAQTTQAAGTKPNPLPDAVNKIVEKTCMKCHAEPGNAMAQSRVNLTKWAEYSTEKQASKAKSMCKEMTKGKMPPKNFRKENPDVIPTAEEIKTICDWSQSLQVPKK